MATRSCIGVKCGNKVVAIYAHWDGYVSHMGKYLDEYYNGLSPALTLIVKGDLSSIGSTIEECNFYNEPLGASEFREFNSVEKFTSHYIDCGCEFAYLYFTDTETWKVCNLSNVDKDNALAFCSLSQAVEATILI